MTLPRNKLNRKLNIQAKFGKNKITQMNKQFFEQIMKDYKVADLEMKSGQLVNGPGEMFVMNGLNAMGNMRIEIYYFVFNKL